MVLGYYPFGLKHKGYNDVVSANSNSVASKFKYNGMELEESLGVDWYEMDMRQYDPAIARWTAIDPVTHHEFSTYSTFDNNPVIFADPSGADSDYGAEIHRQRFVEGGGASETYSGDDSANPPPPSEGCCDALKEWFNDLLTWGGTEEEMDDAEEARELLNSIDRTAKKVWKTEKEIAGFIPGGSVLMALLEGDGKEAALVGAGDVVFSVLPGGVIIKKGGKKVWQKVDILFENRSDGMNWVRKQLGHNTEKIKDANGKIIGLKNEVGDKVYWGHGDWYNGRGSSTFPHLNYQIGNGTGKIQSGHIFLKNKIKNVAPKHALSSGWKAFKAYFNIMYKI